MSQRREGDARTIGGDVRRFLLLALVLVSAQASLTYLATPANAYTLGHANRSFYVYQPMPLAALQAQACAVKTGSQSTRSAGQYVILQFGAARAANTGVTAASTAEQGATGYRKVNGSSAFMSYQEMANIAVNFLEDWLTCGGNYDRVPKLHLIIGVSNDIPNGVSRANGQALQEIIQRLDFIGTLIDQTVFVEGGFDFEVGYAPYSQTLAEAQGFSDAAQTGDIYNYYGNNGCASSTSLPAYTATQPCGPTGGGYTTEGIYTLAYGLRAAYPLPQVYNQSNLTQWTKIQQYSYTAHGLYMTFIASLSENDGCENGTYDSTCAGRFSPDDTWSRLSSAVAGDPYIDGETDIGPLPYVAAGGVI